MFQEKKISVGDFLYKVVMGFLSTFLLLGGGVFYVVLTEWLNRDPVKIFGFIPATIPVKPILILLSILGVAILISMIHTLLSQKEIRLIEGEDAIKEHLKRETRYNPVFLDWLSSYLVRNNSFPLNEFMEDLGRILSLYYRGEEAEEAIQETRPTWDEVQDLALGLLNPDAEGYEEIKRRVKIWIRDKRRKEIEIT